MSPLCLFLVGAITLCGPSQSSAQTWQYFYNTHIDENRDFSSPDYCTDIILKRGIRDGEFCKRFNTFIGASSNLLKGQCGGVSYGQVVTKSKFKVANCLLQGPMSQKPCIYDTLLPSRKQLILQCDNKIPVHLNGLQ